MDFITRRRGGVYAPSLPQDAGLRAIDHHTLDRNCGITRRMAAYAFNHATAPHRKWKAAQRKHLKDTITDVAELKAARAELARQYRDLIKEACKVRHAAHAKLYRDRLKAVK